MSCLDEPEGRYDRALAVCGGYSVTPLPGGGALAETAWGGGLEAKGETKLEARDRLMEMILAKLDADDGITEAPARPSALLELGELPPGEDFHWIGEAALIYARMIEDGMPFAQVNYGDGEWGCILGRKMTNAQGETYEPPLTEALGNTLRNPRNYWHGTNSGPALAQEVAGWLKGAGTPPIRWVYKETLSGANVNGRLGPFFRAVRSRRTLVVGPAHLANVDPRATGGAPLIVVPDSTAWKVSAETAKEVASRLKPGDLVLFASGMATNLTVHSLWPEWGPKGVTMLDVGACLDPYAGVFSRKGYLKESFQNVAIERNLT